MDFDNGWFYVEHGATLVLSDGTELDEYTFEQDNERISAPLSDVSATDAVGPTSIATLNLINGGVECDTYGNA